MLKFQKIKQILILLLLPRQKDSFLNCVPKNAKILDVGCGNNSPYRVKSQRPDVFYVGLDVSNYNQEYNPDFYADQYIIVSPDEFADRINGFHNLFDVVISSHNLEHCSMPEEVLNAMLKTLKKGGLLYISFPCEESVYFPKSRGTLNFYDDPTHLQVISFDNTINIIKSKGFIIDFAVRRYRPFILSLLGLILEPIRFITKYNMPFGSTWAFYGLESIIWVSKPN